MASMCYGMKRRGLLTVVLVATLFAACGNNKPFNATAWVNADARERGRMSQDLVDSKVLVGKTIEQAKQALGEPQKDWGRVIQYSINLGWPLKDPKHYGLQVQLDENRTVREVRIVD